MLLEVNTTIEDLAPSCDTLFKQYESENLFLGKKWFHLYESYFLAESKNYYISIFNDQHQALALFLLNSPSNKSTKTSVFSNSNFYTPYFQFLLDKSLSSEESKLIFEFFIQKFLQLGQFDSITLSPLIDLNSTSPQSSINLNALLLHQLKKNNFITNCYTAFANWTYTLNQQTYSEYFSLRPSQVKNTIKRKTKKLTQLHSHEIKVYQTPEDINFHISEYEKIYQLSWKPKEASNDFIRQIMLSYAEQGFTRLGILYIDNIPVASQFWLIHNKIASIYKLAYNPDYRQFSVGSILTAQMMKNAIDIDAVEKLDYLTGDDQYKQDWMNHRKELITLVAYNKKTIRGLFLGLNYLSKTLVKKVIKQFAINSSMYAKNELK